MPSWSEVEAAVPELAKAAQEAFDAHKHKVLATLRADGSPRLSGNEAVFRDGEVWLGMMHRSLKALDLKRDPRMELHSAPVDVDFVSNRRADVLEVPVTALLALPKGGFGVEVVDGLRTQIVPVRTGMFAAGQVDVRGKGIAAGMRVGVPK